MYNLLVYVVFFIKFANIFTQTCNFVSDHEVYYDKDKTVPQQSYSTKISGCITNTSFEFENVEVIAFYCKSQNLPVLEDHFVNNMKFLKLIYIGPCLLQTIERCALYNLPALTDININANGPLRKIVEGVFNVVPTLENILIFKNQVNEVEDNAFSNLPNLRSLVLGENRLTHIKREWFTNTTNIEDIKLYQNLIRTIPEGMFHDWTKLKFLDLSANYISKIEGPLIKNNAPIMNVVSLHRNLLTTVSLEMFSNSTLIEYLLLSGNHLNYIPEDLLRNLRVSEVSIFGNKFTCPCYNKIFEIFYGRTILIDRPVRLTNLACKNDDVPACGYSRNHTKACVEAVDEELTERIITHMKKIGYNTMVDYTGQQCATFDVSDE